MRFPSKKGVNAMKTNNQLSVIDNSINEIYILLKFETKALKRKKDELAKRVHVQQNLFFDPPKPRFFEPTLFEVKTDISEANLKRVFVPYQSRINYLQSELERAKYLKSQAEESEKLQLCLY